MRDQSDRDRQRPWDWNDDSKDWRTVLRFKYHGHQDPTADEAICRAELDLVTVQRDLQDRYPTIFAAARHIPYNEAQLVAERAALKRQAHLTHA